MTKTRVEAFSDGVIAIIITIMVLEMKVPQIHSIKEVNGSMMWANLHLLFWLSLIPFASGWMGENHFEPKTLAVYALLLNLCGVAYYVLLKVIQSCNRDNETFRVVLEKQSRKGMLSMVLYTIAIPAAFLHEAIAGVLIIMVAILWLIPDRNIEKAEKEH
ncbi:MAG: DUF1211 domain-containing protein [Chitinophagaceae bacterium]|nr:DUF1211 domain-containing protein [Chitinophagaceae bacterium]